jgi:HlyD family secretion protein
MRVSRKHAAFALAALGAMALVWLLLRPTAITVNVAAVTRGPMQVTVDEEGETRVRDRYVVAAPITARIARIELQEGDSIAARAVVTRMFPTPLDERAREQAVARVAAAEDARRAADAAVAQARAAFVQARRDCERAQTLAAGNLVAPEERERAELVEASRARELEAAEFRAQAAEHDVETARAVLRAGAGAGMALRSPVGGRILRLPERSERIVAAGTPLAEVGDPARLEVVADLLSADAVKLEPGDPVLIEGWGGDSALHGRLRRVEPSGFTKISALGVEEQRVNVIVDFVDPPASLGDRYRVEVRIVLWEASDVLKVPAGALFRDGEGWSVFAVRSGRAVRRLVEVGHRNPSEAEVLSGLEEGEAVIRNPSDRIADGVRVTPLGS